MEHKTEGGYHVQTLRGGTLPPTPNQEGGTPLPPCRTKDRDPPPSGCTHPTGSSCGVTTESPFPHANGKGGRYPVQKVRGGIPTPSPKNEEGIPALPTPTPNQEGGPPPPCPMKLSICRMDWSLPRSARTCSLLYNYKGGFMGLFENRHVACVGCFDQFL